MSSNTRNINILRKIIQYCNEIDEAHEQFGKSYERLQSDSVYKNAIAMCILQIGELTIHLTDKFRAQYTEMPWKSIRDMRNIAAHRYGSFDMEILWKTTIRDTPALRNYCAKIIKQYETLNQEAVEEPDPDTET